MIGNKLFNKSDSEESDSNDQQRPLANNDNEQKSDISLKSKQSIDIISLNSINMETRSLSIKSKDFTLDIDNLNLSYSAKRAFQNILGETGDKTDSEGMSSGNSDQYPKNISPNNRAIYDKQVSQYGVDKANQLADIRENPMTWSGRYLYPKIS